MVMLSDCGAYGSNCVILIQPEVGLHCCWSEGRNGDMVLQRAMGVYGNC